VAKKSKSQIWLEYAAARSLLAVLTVLPLRLSVAVAMLLGSFAYRFLGRLRRIGLKNLEIAFPEKTLDERKAILKNAFRNMGRVMAYFSRFNRLSYDTMTSVIEYDPDPPFDAGSPEKLPPEMVELVRAFGRSARVARAASAAQRVSERS